MTPPDSRLPSDGKGSFADRAAALLASDRIDDVVALFDSPETDRPFLRWSPSVDELPNETMRGFLQTWDALPRRDGQNLPNHEDFDVFDFRLSMGYMFYLDVLEEGADFRYRVFGSRLAEFAGLDWSGRTLSSYPASTYSRDFMLTGFKAILLRREPLQTQHSSPRNHMIATWHRIVVPLIDDGGVISRILGMNVPASQIQRAKNQQFDIL